MTNVYGFPAKADTDASKPFTLKDFPWDSNLGKPHIDINAPLDSSYKPEPPINDLARYKDGICQKASKLVNGERGEQHGDMIEQHKLAARLWTAYLGMKITAEEVATCMELLKISRSKCGTSDPDHYIDRAGYAEVSWECRNAGC